MSETVNARPDPLSSEPRACAAKPRKAPPRPRIRVGPSCWWGVFELPGAVQSRPYRWTRKEDAGA